MAVPDIRFCQLPSGSRVAYASAGEGPPLVMVPGWLCHVEEIWTHPSAASALEKLSANHRFIWYDRLGCGLSDRDGFTPSLENDVEQLQAVLKAAGVRRCALIGYSFGGAAAVALAAAAPEVVDRLVLYATWANGANVSSGETFAAFSGMIRANWNLSSRTFATLFLPNARGQDIAWFSRFQRRAAHPEMAIELLSYVRTQDVRTLLPDIRTPTLVLTNRRDPTIHTDNSRELAAGIPGATLHILDGNEHEPFIRDSGSVVETILAFIEGRPITNPAVPHPAPGTLTPREQEVLRLIAEGDSNKAIARKLGIQVATVERHVANVYAKLDVKGRADAAMHAVAMKLVPVPGG